MPSRRGAFGILLAPDLVVDKSSTTRPRARLAQAVHRSREWRDGVPAWLHESFRSIADKPRPTFTGLGLNTVYLVPRAGFEPALQP